MPESQILNNYDTVVKRVKEACLRSGRDFGGVTILPVTKYARNADIAALLAGRDIFAVGESRLQDSVKKWAAPELAQFKAQKFFIGALQSNKIAKIVESFDLIASVESLDKAVLISRAAQNLGRQTPCLVQIKLTDRQTQRGVALKEAAALISRIRKDCPWVIPNGLMAIAPVTDDPESLRPLFREVKTFFDGNFGRGSYLSLGMSGDYEIAVEEGSNLPRLGSVIFKIAER
jgi:pyridoxal phosphate enzyme (YggS family)